MQPKPVFVSALILAAGRGSRMGRTKQLLAFEGRPVLSHVIAAALGARLGEVVIVLGYEAASVRDALGPMDGIRFVENPDFADGQSSSLSLGLDAVDARSQAAVVLLGDQPTITSSDIDRVVEAYCDGEAAAARAVYESGGKTINGHPTVLGRVLWDEIRGVEGDVGARDVLARHGDSVLRVPLGKSPPSDLDTPADYDALVDPLPPRG